MLNKLIYMAATILGLTLFQSCAPANHTFEEAPKRNISPDTPISELSDLICGGGRSMGKHVSIGGNECSMPASTDQSCDRWGCAVVVNEQGDSDCPAGTVKRITDTTPVEYFICIQEVTPANKPYSVCGGTRMPGKYANPEECTDPVTNDNTCNRFGCAIQYNSQGDSTCPSGATMVRISDNLTSVLCLR
jgi:hypothetical protein